MSQLNCEWKGLIKCSSFLISLSALTASLITSSAFTYIVTHNEFTSRTASVESTESIFPWTPILYNGDRATLHKFYVNIMHHGRMFTIRASWRRFAWTRRSALVRGYGKTGRLRPRTCMCRPFQNAEFAVSLPSYAITGRAVLRVSGWRNRAILRNPRK